MKNTRRHWLLLLLPLLLATMSALAAARQPAGYADAKADVKKSLVGVWTDRGSGEEVRFRDPNGLLILTVTHNTEFTFTVDDRINVRGKGTIAFDLGQNTQGLDSLVARVQGLMRKAPVPGVPGAIGAVAGSVGDKTGDVRGVTSMQYQAPHLMFGKELRRYEIVGRVLSASPGRYVMDLTQMGPFTRADGSIANDLVAAWEVNLSTQEKRFSCWSPFLTASAAIEQQPGHGWTAAFQEQGTHRNNVPA